MTGTDTDGRRAQMPLAALASALRNAAGELVGEPADRPIALERPPNADLGDYSTNAALVLAGAARRPPRELAQLIGKTLQGELGDRLSGFEVAGPGFLNLRLDDRWHLQALAEVIAVGERFGADGVDEGGTRAERILVEFVSANPTGPMHVGHARNAAYGDALARLLVFHGHEVEREFYVNDAGTQVRKLGESIRAIARGEQVPADGYQGAYVEDLVAQIAGAGEMDMDVDGLGRAAVALLLGQIEASLARFNVLGYDHWQYESKLHEARGDLRGADGKPVSAVEHALQLLERAGHTYEEDGALWLRTTAFGDDKDRVLVRGSGEHTYFASDIAYHQAKRERGFTRQINVWGADHHGYMQRMCAAYEALGGDPGELEMLIIQLVHLVRAGQRAQMSKRAGEFVTLDDLVQEIGVDAARWYLLSRSHDTTIDLDLDLAVKQSSENPVYYVQYAHARIASVLSKAGDERVRQALAELGVAHEISLHDSERAVIKQLLQWPQEIAEAAARRAPHRIAVYALELAQVFTAFYRDCRVIGERPAAVESRRIALSVGVQRVLACALGMLGVSGPEEM